MTVFAPKALKSILLIDDDELIAGSLRQVLQTDGCDVEVAVDPCSAVNLMTKKSFEVILVDPYLTGAIHDDASLIESVRAHQSNAFIIVLTAYASPALEAIAGHFRSAVVLSKPQSLVTLSGLVAGAFAGAWSSPAPNSLAQRMIE